MDYLFLVLLVFLIASVVTNVYLIFRIRELTRELESASEKLSVSTQILHQVVERAKREVDRTGVIEW